MSRPAQYNIDDWLTPSSPSYKPEIASAVFHYAARIEKDDQLEVCIQTQEMIEAAWNYTHGKQLILDGTFGICNSKVLLFICMEFNEENKSVPLSFLLFSAPSGNRTTQAGYDISVLKRLLENWHISLGSRDGAVRSQLRRRTRVNVRSWVREG